MNITLTDLLKRALMVRATEVKLVPGRRTIVVLPHGESEVKGEPQTPDKIHDLLAPVMTPEARRALSSGWAEWDFPLEGKGPVRACVEVKLGLPHASLFLDRCDEGSGIALDRGDAGTFERLAVAEHRRIERLRNLVLVGRGFHQL
jgi:hypothetical protein